MPDYCPQGRWNLEKIFRVTWAPNLMMCAFNRTKVLSGNKDFPLKSYFQEQGRMVEIFKHGVFTKLFWICKVLKLKPSHCIPKSWKLVHSFKLQCPETLLYSPATLKRKSICVSEQVSVLPDTKMCHNDASFQGHQLSIYWTLKEWQWQCNTQSWDLDLAVPLPTCSRFRDSALGLGVEDCRLDSHWSLPMTALPLTPWDKHVVSGNNSLLLCQYLYTRLQYGNAWTLLAGTKPLEATRNLPLKETHSQLALACHCWGSSTKSQSFS